MEVGKHWTNAFPSLPPGRQFWGKFHCCWVTKSCPTLCNPMDCSTPGSSVFHHHLEFAEICPLSRWCYLTITSSSCPLLFLPSIFHSIRIKVTLDQRLAIHCVSQHENVFFHCFIFFLLYFSSPYNLALTYGNIFSYKIFMYYPLTQALLWREARLSKQNKNTNG